MKKKNIILFAKSTLASIICAVLDLIIFTVLTKIFKKEYFYVVLAGVLARIVSATISFILNKKLVFKSDGNIRKESLSFFILIGIKMLLSSFIVAGLVVTFKSINETVIKSLIDTILFVIGYFIQKKYIFKV